MEAMETNRGQPIFKLRLLGVPAMTWQAQPFTLPRRQTRALLFRLAVDAQSVSREELVDLLWSEKAPTTARRNLTRLLSYLRTLLPHPNLI